MIIQSNTGYFGIGNPVLRRGMSGLGDAAVSNPSGNWWSDPSLWTAINSESLFGANLYRGLTNQQPLNVQQYAPQVAVGLSPDTMNLVLLGGAALLAVMLLKGRKGKRR